MPELTGHRIEDRSRRLAQQARRDLDGRWRVDAVTTTLLAMVDQQRTLASGAAPMLDTGLGDDQLADTCRAVYVLLAARHPTLFPPSYELPDAATLRGWLELVTDVDLLCRSERRPTDYVTMVFTHAVPMNAKQANGAYYTPSAVAHAMAIALGTAVPWEDDLLEPAVGSGSMITAAWVEVSEALRAAHERGELTAETMTAALERWSRAVTGVDVDAEAVWTAAAQHAVRTGFPGRFLHGSALELDRDLPAVVHPYARQLTPFEITAFRWQLSRSVAQARAGQTRDPAA